MDTRITPLQPVITAPEQVPVIKPFNIDMKVLLTSEDTAGAMFVIMAWHKPGEGPPDHVHFNQEEIFFIVDGRYELTIDGQTSIGGPGTLVFVPRNTVHPGGSFTGDKLAELNKEHQTTSCSAP